MNEKIIRFPKENTEKEENREELFKVGDYVHLKGNYDEQYNDGNIFGTIGVNDVEYFKHKVKEKYVDLVKEAFGLRWKIIHADFVDDAIMIRTTIYGYKLDITVTPSILVKSIDQKDRSKKKENNVIPMV